MDIVMNITIDIAMDIAMDRLMDGIQMDSETGQVVTHGVTKLEILKIVVTDTTVEIITTTEHDNVMGMDTECQVLVKLWFLLEWLLGLY